jgi:predicted nucleic acid-binding protein
MTVLLDLNVLLDALLVLEIATTLPGSDFEDNLQIACAVEAKLDAIVTRNPKDFADSPVPVLTPTELLALLAKVPDA